MVKLTSKQFQCYKTTTSHYSNWSS